MIDCMELLDEGSNGMDEFYDVMVKLTKATGMSPRCVDTLKLDEIYGSDHWEQPWEQWEEAGVMERVDCVRFTDMKMAGAGTS